MHQNSSSQMHEHQEIEAYLEDTATELPVCVFERERERERERELGNRLIKGQTECTNRRPNRHY